MPDQRTTTPRILIGAVALAVALGVGPQALARNSLDVEAQKEIDRGLALESDVETELRRQEELLRSIDLDKQMERALKAAAQEEVNLLERANTRIAPRAPVDRQLPVSLFEAETVEDKDGRKIVVKRSLDADRDGHPEQIRYLDPQTGQMVRKESDRDYDGAIDSWQTYSGGEITAREIDSNGDGRVDQWEKFSRGRLVERSIDRDTNGRKDATFKYSGDSLVEERHDRNNDGKPDLIKNYRERFLVKMQEDRTKNGQIDSWTSYGINRDRELPIRIERDTNGSGAVDIVEIFDINTGKPIIERREEDKDGDGVPDVISMYRKGKLYKREITNPDLVDL